MKISVFSIVLVGLAYSVNGDVFTALSDLEGTLRLEEAMSNNLRAYVREEYKRLDELSKIADDYEKHAGDALVDPEKFLSNALNSYLLVKKFTTDWKPVHGLLTKNSGEEFLTGMQEYLDFLPTVEDLEGAAAALLRLQDTYALPTEKIANGELQGVKESLKLTAGDCFELGRIAYNRGDHYHVVMWMGQALEMTNAETNKTVDQVQLLDYLAYSLYMQGNIAEALNLTDQWLSFNPENERAINNKKYYIQMLAEQEVDTKGDEGGETPTQKPFQNKRILDDYRKSEEFMAYEALCRGEDTHVVPGAHTLTCQYKRHHPLFYIAPLKEETMFHDPWIVQYHDVMTDDEVTKIKQIAKPRLHRSGVFTYTEADSHYTKYRTSKSAWLRDDEHEFIRRVSNRVRALSNLTLFTAEELQVVNYGIGGHYEPHYDFARPDEIASFDPMAGNRIATAIFYMTDVPAGGLTVFPQIGAKVYPVAKSMAFWYNLKANGEGDYMTRHAGCPVLTGSKWVANKWIHERGQEFTRPCDINPNL